MKLYEKRIEINLSDALAAMFTNNVSGDNFEYMISFDEVTRLVTFGKTWAKKDAVHWGTSVPKYFIAREYCPAIPYDSEDLFLVDLFHDPYMKKYFNQKRFHVWRKI